MRFQSAPTPMHRALAPLGVAMLLTVLLVGCGDDEKAGTDDTTTTSEESTTSTSEPESTTSETTATTEAGGTVTDKTEPDGPVDQSGTPAWQLTAVPYRGQTGEIIEVECTPDGEERFIWGTNVYTDDSSICNAAVHVGLITFDDGGTVSIEILDGMDEYFGTEANGLESLDYGAWGGSFSFPDADEIAVDEAIPWNRVANYYQDEGEADVTVTCETDGTPGGVWGTDIYTDDSSICTAAVHVGLITVEDGGEVTFHLIEGQSSYLGTEANGITSSSYGAFHRSFEFVDDEPT